VAQTVSQVLYSALYSSKDDTYKILNLGGFKTIIIKMSTQKLELPCYLYFFQDVGQKIYDKWVPVTMAWCVLRLRIQQKASSMEGRCEYIE
jgi:hypothetical protein